MSGAGFVTSAPGKVIVFGEHAVVHKKRAIAAAISLRSYLWVDTRSSKDPQISLSCPDIGLQCQWSVDSLQSLVQAAKEPPRTLDPALLAALEPLMPPSSAICRAAVQSFLYLFLFLPCLRDTRYVLRSNIPVGAGLGSSASISVCIATALLLQRGQVESAETINAWAFVGEMCIHGNPSGVDNTVSSHGKAVLFQREDYALPPRIVPLPAFPKLPLLLVNTRVSRSTAVEVAKVAALKSTLPDITETILDGIDKVVQKAHDLIARDQSSAQTLGSLVDINHGLLVSLGVSHPRLERVRELVTSANVGNTKLTGAGGGGSAITLLKPAVSAADLAHLESQLLEEGFDRYETTLAGAGAGVLYEPFCSCEDFESASSGKPLANLMDNSRWTYW